MIIRFFSVLPNDYMHISDLTKVSGEPIFIIQNGEDDGICMSLEAFDEQEKMFCHRDTIYAAEISRLNGEPTVTADELYLKRDDLLNASSNSGTIV